MKYLMLLFLLCNTFVSLSQVTVYKTFQDFENKTGQQYDEFKNVFKVDSKVRLILIKDNVKSKIRCKDIWGFTWKKALFRSDTENGGYLPVRVLAQNKLIYYENGMAHIRMLLTDINSSYYRDTDGFGAYISLDLNSTMVPLSKGMNLLDRKRVKKRVREFKNENPEFNDFFNCLSDYKTETVRSCISEFEGYEWNQ